MNKISDTNDMIKFSKKFINYMQENVEKDARVIYGRKQLP